MKTIATLMLLTWPVLWSAAQTSLPDVDVRDMDGKNISASSLIQPGAPTLVVFWKSNDNKCCDNLETLDEAWNSTLRSQGMKMVVICTDCNGNWSHVKPIVNGNGWEFETYVDVNGDLKRAMNVGEGPCTMLFDENENMLCRYNAACSGSSDYICENFVKHLGSPMTADAKKVGR